MRQTWIIIGKYQIQNEYDKANTSIKLWVHYLSETVFEKKIIILYNQFLPVLVTRFNKYVR